MRMKVAVISDVHANLPAFEAALGAIEAEQCDAIYHLGDVIGIGPYPAECLDRLQGLPSVRAIMGNHDAWFAFGLPDPIPSWMSDGEVRHHLWTHAQINPALRRAVASWPFSLREPVGRVRASFIHYGLDETGQNFVPIVENPTMQDLDIIFACRHESLVFYGHHHPPADSVGKARYVNPGSLGCGTEPVARFVILEVQADGTHRIEHRTVPYNAAELLQQLKVREVPERAFIRHAFFPRTHVDSSSMNG